MRGGEGRWGDGAMGRWGDGAMGREIETKPVAHDSQRKYTFFALMESGLASLTLGAEEKESIIREFKSHLISDVAVPVSAMRCLISVIGRSSSITYNGLLQELEEAIACIRGIEVEELGGRTNISLFSGCDIFMKYVTRSLKTPSQQGFEACKSELISKAREFNDLSSDSRRKIAELSSGFIQDRSRVLVHGNSRVVTALILKAAESKQFNIVVTDGRPSADGMLAAKTFVDAGIPTTLINDAAVGKYMENIDLCLVGAEGGHFVFIPPLHLRDCVHFDHTHTRIHPLLDTSFLPVFQVSWRMVES